MSPPAEPDVTDAMILAEIRPLLLLTEQQAEYAHIVERLRLTEDPAEIAERSRAGDAMAELDKRLCDETCFALYRLGLWHGARMIEYAMERAAEED